MKIGSLCTGYGGLDMAVQAVFGARLAWWSDIEPGPIRVMSEHSDSPNLGDLKEVDWSSVEPVNILTAGYPCQPFSNAGKRLGTEDPRHIWPWIERAISVLRPRVVVLENVAGHLRRGFDIVLSDLAALGYDVRWSVVRASDVGAPHRRERLYVIAEDPDQQSWIERRPSTAGEAEGGWSRSDPGRRSGVLASDTGSPGLEIGPIESDGHKFPTAERSSSNALADSEGFGRDERGSEHAGLVRAPDAPRDSGERLARWGDYSAAIGRWERIVGRIAPEPTTTGARGATVLNPVFVEWMMGLPDGHVTDVQGLSRNQQLRLLGNGVVPQQAEYAIRTLMAAS